MRVHRCVTRLMEHFAFARMVFAGAMIQALGSSATLSGLGTEEIRSVNFLERSVPEGETLFSELPAERTGIVTTNRYDDPRIWSTRHSEHNVGAIGTGVTVGDYDSDGRPDVFIVSKIESGRLFRNLGYWRFEDVTEKAGVLDESGEWKQGAAFADVDNDGLLDLYVCRFDAPNQLYMNRGDGTFSEEAENRGLAVVDASGMANFADYDRDGWLDVYLQTNLKDAIASIEGQRDYLFRNRGDGTFEDVTDAAGILEQLTQGHSATWWDQNEDGWPDIYIANDFAPQDILYRNMGDGTFRNVIHEALPHTPFSSMGADIGDVDNDGRIDFLVADMAGTTYEKTQRGLSDSAARMPVDHNDQLNTAIQVHANSLFLNTGTERSLEAAHLAGIEGTDWTWSPRFEDLDQDGRLDLFVTNGMDREHNNLDFIVKKLRATNVRQRIAVTKMSPVHREANLAYVNRGDLRFEEVGEEWGLDKMGVSFGSAFGDFDGDGDLDIMVGNYQEGATVLRNDGRAGGSVIVELRGSVSNRFGIGARVELTTESGTQVRELVLARGYLSSSEPVLHFGVGNDKELKRLMIRWPSGAVQEFLGLETNKRYSVVELEGESRGYVDTKVSPLFEEVSKRFALSVVQREEKREGTVDQPLSPRRFNRRGPRMATGDLDGDGIDEIVLAATAVDGAKILDRVGGNYENVAKGAFTKAPPINGGPPLLFDADANGVLDLLLTAGGAAFPAEEPEYEPVLWLNLGDGVFRAAENGRLPSAPISVGAAVAADFNGDGRSDVFLGGRLLPGYYPEPAFSAFWLNSGEGFIDAGRRFAPGLDGLGLVTAAGSGDLDSDGWTDLVVALEWGGVRFFRNKEGRSLEDVSKEWGLDSAGAGLWSALALADFNGDGRLDIALGNHGLNTVYRASREKPLRLYSGEFSGTAAEELVLAFYRDGAYRPIASRNELSKKIPQVAKRFPENDDFAAATLEDVFTEEELEKAALYEVEELRSGVLLSQPNGAYRFSALPRRAQISPVQAMAAGDVDQDGNLDLLIVNNDYSPIPARGRFDGGLGCVLLGDEQGRFKPLPLKQSGFVVPGNPKALLMADIDGDGVEEVLVSRNNQSLLVFDRGAE